MRLMVIFGTRPELIKLAPVIAEARKRTQEIDLITCSTGQHKEMLEQAMKVFDITPDEDLALMQPNQTLSELTAKLLMGLDVIFRKHCPDVVVVQGDTSTAFVAALAAYYQRIPIAHVEAGLRTGDLYSPFPEEGNRLLIARLAKWHFPPTQQAAEKLLSEGVATEQIQVTGNTVVDAIEMIKKKWKCKPYSGEASNLFPGRKIGLITTHRRENFGEGLEHICSAIRKLCLNHSELGFVFPVHLNPNVREVVYGRLADLENLQMISPVDFETSLYLQSRSCLILTDSGGIQEESPSFGVPCVVMREHTERAEGILAGFAQLAGTDSLNIIALSEDILLQNRCENLHSKPNPYGDGLSASRIVDRLVRDVSPSIGDD
ncbi:UDP-N-acetylglucosamine 2-epimerase (non-hydrolyzing) [Polynucleobacter sphagniphilus]|nr:UDP-N-acetylglucosamine 2-epimerase (non-hydrolyzing) [Polynucleobacter sphagniphilus]MDH6420912.1 UDP-N-acetylglucosamine 2-epimerase (non-hydrolyzing) [Polynucleobacter sphagniphilus]